MRTIALVVILGLIGMPVRPAAWGNGDWSLMLRSKHSTGNPMRDAASFGSRGLPLLTRRSRRCRKSRISCRTLHRVTGWRPVAGQGDGRQGR